MSRCTPDPGALTMWKIKFKNNNFEFINAFAANDPASTLKTWELVNERLHREKF